MVSLTHKPDTLYQSSFLTPLLETVLGCVLWFPKRKGQNPGETNV